MIQRNGNKTQTKDWGRGPVGPMPKTGSHYTYIGAVSVFSPEAVPPDPTFGMFSAVKKAYRERLKARKA